MSSTDKSTSSKKASAKAQPPAKIITLEGEDHLKAKRPQVKNACVHCQRACKKCDGRRPCERCTRLGLEECVDSARKARKRNGPRSPTGNESNASEGSLTPVSQSPALPAKTQKASANASSRITPASRSKPAPVPNSRKSITPASAQGPSPQMGVPSVPTLIAKPSVSPTMSQTSSTAVSPISKAKAQVAAAVGLGLSNIEMPQPYSLASSAVPSMAPSPVSKKAASEAHESQQARELEVKREQVAQFGKVMDNSTMPAKQHQMPLPPPAFRRASMTPMAVAEAKDGYQAPSDIPAFVAPYQAANGAAPVASLESSPIYKTAEPSPMLRPENSFEMPEATVRQPVQNREVIETPVVLPRATTNKLTEDDLILLDELSGPVINYGNPRLPYMISPSLNRRKRSRHSSAANSEIELMTPGGIGNNGAALGLGIQVPDSIRYSPELVIDPMLSLAFVCSSLLGAEKHDPRDEFDLPEWFKKQEEPLAATHWGVGESYDPLADMVIHGKRGFGPYGTGLELDRIVLENARKKRRS